VVQSILYEVGLFVVAVYGKVVVWGLALEHAGATIPVVVIVGVVHGFSAISIEPLKVVPLMLAVPPPVEPTVGFIPHAAPLPMSKVASNGKS
jgi:hypothetical protein